MEVLVTGGTGFIGQNLCAELVDRGHDVTAMSRSPNDEVVPSAVRTVSGDVTEPATLEEPIAGQDAVVNLVSLSPLFKPPAGQTHESVHFGGTKHLLEVAERQGVDRFVQQSALDANPEANTGYLRAKGRAESAVIGSDLGWVISRPSVVFGEGAEFVEFTKQTKRWFAPGLPIAPLPGGGRTRFQPIWVGDLAPILATIVEDEAHLGETYEFAGPDVLSLADVTRKVFRAEGRSITVVPVPMPVAAVGLTAMEYLPMMPFGIDQYRSLRIDNTTDENAAINFVKTIDELKTFDAYLGLSGG